MSPVRFTPEGTSGIRFTPEAVAGDSADNPIDEQGVTEGERFVTKYFGSPAQQKEWLERAPGERGKPTGIGKWWDPTLGYLTGEPTRQYETKEYKPGKLSLRAKGSSDKWKVIDESGFTPADLGDIAPEIGSMAVPGGTALKSAAGMGIFGGITRALGGLYGVDTSLKDVAEEAGIGAAAGGIAHGIGKVIAPASKGVGKLLQLPQKGLDLITRNPEKAALKEARVGVDQARGALGKETLKATEDAAQRASTLDETMAAGAKAAKEAAPAGAKIAAGVPPEDVAGAMAAEPSGSVAKFLSSLIDPAYGVKAKYLQNVPEFTEIIQTHFGPLMRNKLGSESMEQGAKHRARWISENPQDVVSKTTLAYAQDIARWMLGSQYKDVLSAAERAAVGKMATGTAKEAEQAMARDALEKVIQKAMPEGVEVAKAGVKTALAKRAIAKAAVTRPAEGFWEKTGEGVSDFVGSVAGPMKNTEVGRILRTAGNIASLGTSRVASGAGKGLEWLGSPANIQAAIAKAPGPIRPLLAQAAKRGPNAFRALVWSLAQRMPSIRKWLDEASAEAGDQP